MIINQLTHLGDQISQVKKNQISFILNCKPTRLNCIKIPH